MVHRHCYRYGPSSLLQIWFITIATDRVHRQCTRSCFITTMLGVVFDRHCAKWFIAIPVLDRWFIAVVADRGGSQCGRQRWFNHIVPDRDGSQCGRQRWFNHIVPDRGGSSPLWQTAVVHRHCGRQRWFIAIVADSGGSSPFHCGRQRWFIASHAGPLSPYVTPRRSQRHR